MAEKNLQKLSDTELKLDIEGLVSAKKKLVREVDNLDTLLIGYREEIRRRAELKEKQDTICNQIDDD